MHDVLSIERNQLIFKTAYTFLLGFQEEGVTTAILHKYMNLPDTRPRPGTIAGIYQRLLFSAQNANMRTGVIGKAIGGVDQLGIVLFNFDPRAVLNYYTNGWEHLLDVIERDLQPNGQIRRGAQSIWPSYCKTILSAASFMTQFQTSEDFYQWANFFDNDDRARPALPMLIDAEIHGIGFALACDFLKELGYLNFAKPDVHIRDIFVALHLCAPKAKDFEILQAVVRLASHVNQTPYAVDKLFWLIGSGYFYEDPHIGKSGHIGGQKHAFISHVDTL